MRGLNARFDKVAARSHLPAGPDTSKCPSRQTSPMTFGALTPYWVIVGDNDPGLDADAARTFVAWHPNAELQVIPSCGHYPMQECPPYFATVIERFLKLNAI
ncbi:alpha/beta fold hydrolase [Burkholderia multivorans]|uniref:alpha/beta fold hydrolase n=1 Tax=Burkholderia multivorans TaxID=87883 RepID=UPI0009E0DBA0|nr:alpha/beta hydrolase [Burkholderia multivorans]MDN7743917.1 alpha/beta hydrolase [Burkholderia multivorans]SAJ61787.1 alpha/beta hydrolase [Burkholderia multivorans]SAJ89189.1 alpha/beta hydrolase [Burkholderia multivorans]